MFSPFDGEPAYRLPLRAGDQVRFFAYDEWTTVDAIDGKWAICSWTYGGVPCHGRFLLSILENCERRVMDLVPYAAGT